MNYIQIYSQLLHCNNCGTEYTRCLIDRRSEFARSLVEWFGETHLSNPEYIKRQARRIGIPIKENLTTREGLCDKCYDGRSDDDIKLLNRLELYSRNIKNIEKENFKQEGTREKHIKYQLLMRNEILKWESRIVFMPTPIPEEDCTFYLREDLSIEGLEQLLEV